ncbi:hypothetical protein [Mycolicibacterium smegmatis]|nr:hypothetical protein [Mycolicibacterium smegmatis]
MHRSWRAGFLAAAAAVAVGGAVITAQAGIDKTQPPNTPRPAVSGQDVFRGVVFGQGVVAQQLGDRPSLIGFYRVSYASNNEAGQLAAADEVMDRIQAADPNYFTRFADAITSGNPFAVSDTLVGVEDQLRKVGLRPDTIATRSPVNYQFNMNVHTNINLVLNENLVVMMNAVTVTAKPASLTDAFQRELMVGEIAATLRA